MPNSIVLAWNVGEIHRPLGDGVRRWRPKVDGQTVCHLAPSAVPKTEL